MPHQPLTILPCQIKKKKKKTEIEMLNDAWQFNNPTVKKKKAHLLICVISSSSFPHLTSLCNIASLPPSLKHEKPIDASFDSTQDSKENESNTVSLL